MGLRERFSFHCFLFSTNSAVRLSLYITSYLMQVFFDTVCPYFLSLAWLLFLVPDTNVVGASAGNLELSIWHVRTSAICVLLCFTAVISRELCKIKHGWLLLSRILCSMHCWWPWMISKGRCSYCLLFKSIFLEKNLHHGRSTNAVSHKCMGGIILPGGQTQFVLYPQPMMW